MRGKIKVLKKIFVLAFFVGSLVAKDVVSMFNEGRYDELLKKYEVILSRDPDMEEAHFGKGTVLYKKGEIEEALREFEKAITIKDPLKKSAVYYNMGNALFKANRLEESLRFYRRAIELNPYDYDAKYNYEFVKRLLNNQQKQKSSGSDTNEEKRQDEKRQDSEKKQKKEKSKKPRSRNQQSEQAQENTPEQKGKVRDQYESVLDVLNENEKKMLKERLKFKPRGIVREKDW